MFDFGNDWVGQSLSERYSFYMVDTEVTASRQIVDALSDLLALMRDELQTSVGGTGLPVPYALALARIDGRVGMKGLAAELRCDPSFVTTIADALEERGLVRREMDPDDRRAKNLVLTTKGLALQSTLQHEFFDQLPGVRELDERERRTFVKLLRKMVGS
ncbi:MAG: hypothetical protein QOG88_699 [Actinomycetota bacterium]|nr:hypothetical protein [Actinomycetota bacterium]